jgi:uncharacterized repeat protein (TIGR03803 family)
MKTRLSETLVLANSSVLVAVLICCHFHATGQVFSTLYNFSAMDFSGYNNDGAHPRAGVMLFGNALYGTAEFGGTYGGGTVFAINADGSNFRTLYNFSGDIDGKNPIAGLILSANTLYGTTEQGGNTGSGGVFAINTDGSGFTALYTFGQLANESSPYAGLVLSGDTLFGTAFGGGSIPSSGAVFALNTNGIYFRNIYWWTDQNGGGPESLVLSNGILYGNSYGGVIYKLNTNGTGFTELHNFAYSDGDTLRGGLVLSCQTLYGIATYGGIFGNGTVFRVNTDGTSFANLYSFSATYSNSISGWNTNSDGANPYGGLALSCNTLYGTTSEGGNSGRGTVFSINTDGTGFKVLHTFTAFTPTNSDGGSPHGDLFLSDNTLYGTTSYGGDFGNGTIFSILLPANPPQLTIARSGDDVILSWPQQAEGFTLESTTDLASPNWTTNSVAPVVVNCQYTVTNSVSHQQQFFRLAQ